MPAQGRSGPPVHPSVRHAALRALATGRSGQTGWKAWHDTLPYAGVTAKNTPYRLGYLSRKSAR